MAATLSEPAVLAAAKDTLYPDLDTSTDHHAVTETRFTKPTWGGWEIPDDLRRRLAPYNTILLTGGEPDLHGVGMPALEVLNADAATTPVAVIDAKGHNTDPCAADVQRDINQVNGHLSEVNQIRCCSHPKHDIPQVDDTDRLDPQADEVLVDVAAAGQPV